LGTSEHTFEERWIQGPNNARVRTAPTLAQRQENRWCIWGMVLQRGEEAIKASQGQAGKSFAFDPILCADFFLFIRMTAKYLL
jgi:hypothetical protein